jgi:eukaryotic-like serine/threonine-protein kinase
MAEADLERLRRYQLMEPLGEGGHGRTFRGIDRQTGREVAIKVLSIKGAGDWKPFDLFEREVAILETLNHPGIPRFVDSYASEESGD